MILSISFKASSVLSFVINDSVTCYKLTNVDVFVSKFFPCPFIREMGRLSIAFHV